MIEASRQDEVSAATALVRLSWRMTCGVPFPFGGEPPVQVRRSSGRQHTNGNSHRTSTRQGELLRASPGWTGWRIHRSLWCCRLRNLKQLHVPAHLACYQNSETFCEPFASGVRLNRQLTGRCQSRKSKVRSFLSMCFLRPSVIRKSLGTERYADPSARFHNETALSTRNLRM